MKKPDKLVPGQRFQRDFGPGAASFERYLILPNGRVEMYESNCGGEGRVYGSHIIPWHQTHELVAATPPAPPPKKASAKIQWGAFWCSRCRVSHSGECP